MLATGPLGVTAPYLAKLSHLARPLLTTYCCRPPVTDNRPRESSKAPLYLKLLVGPTKSAGVVGAVVIEGKRLGLGHLAGG